MPGVAADARLEEIFGAREVGVLSRKPSDIKEIERSVDVGDTRSPRLLVGLRLDPVAASPTPPAAAPAQPRRGFLRRNLPLAVIFMVLGAITVVGMEYYQLPQSGRVRHDYHAWLKPSGYLGQGAGVAALLMFLFMYLYPMRRRMRHRPWLGALPRWLDVHIACGLAVPVVGAIHAGWRFQGLIGLGFLSMVLVSLSGIVGKYLYAHLPHSRAGYDLNMEEVEQRRAALTAEIARKAGLDPVDVEKETAPASDIDERQGMLATLGTLFTADFVRFRTVLRLRRRWGKQCHLDRPALREITRLVRRQIRLTQQRRMIDATRRIFKFWHVVHRPFSITAFAAVVVHVVVVVTMGVTWFW